MAGIEPTGSTWQPHAMIASRRIARLVGKAAIATFALIGLIATLTALALWLAARPVLNAARNDAQAAPQLCASTAPIPQGYPAALRDVQALEQSRWMVFREVCHRHAIASCATDPKPDVTATLGWMTFNQSYLSDCDVRALLLRRDATLGRTLHRLYPGRDPEALTPGELDCVAAVMRYGWNGKAEERGRCTLPKPQAARAAQQPAP